MVEASRATDTALLYSFDDANKHPGAVNPGLVGHRPNCGPGLSSGGSDTGSFNLAQQGHASDQIPYILHASVNTSAQSYLCFLPGPIYHNVQARTSKQLKVFHE